MRGQRHKKSVSDSSEPEEGSEVTDDSAGTESEPEDAAATTATGAKFQKGAVRRKRGESVQYAEESDDSQIDQEDVDPEPGDDNDEHCTICGSKEDWNSLLCCDLCPRTFHLHCFKPPLKAIPKGDWYCSECLPLLQLENVEKFLATRDCKVVHLTVPARGAQAEKAADAGQYAASHKKRRSSAAAVQASGKKQKMASVQALHTEHVTQARSSSISQHSALDTTDADTDSAGQAREPSATPEAASHVASAVTTDDTAAEDVTPAHSKAAPQPDQKQKGEGLQQTALDMDQDSLHASTAAATDAKGGKQTGSHLTDVKEYLVKWKGKSYMHCTWVRHDDVVKMGKQSTGLKSRLRHFLQNNTAAQYAAKNDTEDAMSVGDKRNGIDPDWVTADRVIARQSTKGQHTQYLVKWKGLGYDECTWELEDDLQPKFAAEIARFQAVHPITHERADRKKASASHASSTRSATGRQVGMRKFSTNPACLKGGELHPYQLEGLNWLYFAWEQRKHVILADEMGLGKTIQTIAFLAALKEEHIQQPHLVVVPLSTFPNWEREFALWAPQLNVVPFLGSQTSRDIIKQYEFYAERSHSAKAKSHGRLADQQARVKFHVLLTTYEMAVAEGTVLRSLQWEALVVDEGHRLKNRQSKLFQQLHSLKARQRTLLTGTPLQNNLQELWMLLHFLDAGKFQSLEAFQQDFSDLSHGDQVGKLHELLSPHLLRRLKKDVLKQMPPKKEQIVRVELSSLQKDWYRAILTRNFLNLTTGGKQTGRLKSVMMELRKCCNHPFLMEGQEWPSMQDAASFRQQLVQASGKLALADAMLARMKDRGHRVLIYSQFTILLDLLEEWLNARRWGFQRIDGSVLSSERQSRIDQFNRRPEDNFVFLLSTKAGGLGINLATADTVIIYDSDWNPHNDLQAQARAHRLGQKKPVMIYRLVTRLTIEERMMQQTKKKMVLEHLVVRKMNSAADLKQDELDDILRYGAAELFADAVAASKTEAVTAVTPEGGQSAEAANEKAADKAEKLTQRLSEREQAEGRMGGEAGQRIVYDEAAIERLLDRSDLDKPDASQAEEKDDDFVKAFKVANFEIMTSPDKDQWAADKPKEEEAVLEEQASAKPSAAFWKDLLKDGYTELHVVETAALGKGKRERRQVNYQEKNAKDGNESEYSGKSDGDNESGAETQEADVPAAKRRKTYNYVLTEAEKQAVLPVAQQRQASIAGGHPLTSGLGAHLRIMELSSSQRIRFMKTLYRTVMLVFGAKLECLQLLMHFGLGHQLPGGKFDWSHIHKHMAGSVSLGVVNKYAELVMAQLSEPANDKPYFADGILKKDVLQLNNLNQVLDRLGTLHLIKAALQEQLKSPDTSFSLGTAHALALRTTQHWKAQHDKKLLYGVMKHGWGEWQAIYSDGLLDLETTLRLEVGLPPPSMPVPQPTQTKLPFLPQPHAQQPTSPSPKSQTPTLQLSQPQMLQAHIQGLTSLGAMQTSQPLQNQLPHTQIPLLPPTAPQAAHPIVPQQNQSQLRHISASQDQQPQTQPQSGLPQSGGHQPPSNSVQLPQEVLTKSDSLQHPPAVKAESEAEVFVAAEPQSNGAAEQQADIIQLTKASSPEHQAADNGGMPNSSEGQILNPVPSGPREAGAMKEAAETRHAVMADAAEAQAADTSSKPSITEDKVLDAVASDTSSAGAIKGEAESVDVVMADAPELQLDLSDSPEDSQKPSSHANHDGTGFKQKVSSQSTVTDSQAVAAPAGQAAGLPHQPSDEKPATKTEELVQVKPQPVTGQEPAVKLSILAQSNESVQVKLTVTTQSADTYAVVPVTTASTAQTAGAVLIAAPPALSGQAVGVQASPVAVTPQLGCPKCRYAQLGCTRCREQLRQMTCPEEATKVLAEAAAASRMTNWLVKRMSVLCTALKQRHQLNDLPQRQQQQAQHVVQVRQPVLDQQQAANAPTLQFSAPTNVVRSTKTAYVAPVDTVKGAPAPVQPLKVQVSGTAQPAQQPWQQTAVQMSHFRQQQRMLQQQQALAEAQKQQQNRLILQQAQRQQGAALLQRQHQAAQQQQLQQQRLMARQQLQAQPRGQTAYTQPQADWAAGTGAAQHAKRQHALLQVQQLQARNQQQMQQQLMQQIAGLQTPQQYGHGQLGKQASLPRTSSGNPAGSVPQQQTTSQPPTSLQYQTFPTLPTTSFLPRQGSLQAQLQAQLQPHTQSANQNLGQQQLTAAKSLSEPQLQPGAAQSGLPQRQQSLPASVGLQTQGVQQTALVTQALQQARTASQAQQASATGSARGQAGLQNQGLKGPTDKRAVNHSIKDMLLRVKPNLRAVHDDALPHSAAHEGLSAQALEVRKELVKGNNTLCSQLLDVQVELSQNHPGRMTAEERANAAHRFQAHMRAMEAKCYDMINTLHIKSAKRQPTPTSSAGPSLKPVLRGHSHRHPPSRFAGQERQGSPAMQTQLGSMPAAPTGAPVGPASPATAPIQSGSPAVSAAPSSLGPGTTAPFSRGPGIMASASSGLAHAAAGPATTPVQSGSASFSAAPPSPLSSGTTAPVSAGLGPAAPHRLSAVSGPGSGYWNLSPGVHVPSGGKASGGLASLVAARSAVPGPTISSGGGLKASATAQSAQLRPVVQSANVMHQQSSSQLMTPTNLVHGPSIMQPLNNSPHNLAVASQPSTASGLQQASPMVSARQPDTEPIDLTDD